MGREFSWGSSKKTDRNQSQSNFLIKKYLSEDRDTKEE